MKRFHKALLGAGATMAFGLGGTLAGLAPASAAVSRNEAGTTLQYSVTFTDANGGTYTHSYTVYPDACDPNFTGTGQYPPSPAAAQFDETLSGHTGPGTALTFTDTYFDPSTNQPTGYTYSFAGNFTDSIGDFAGTAVDSDSQTLSVAGTITGESGPNLTHGQYVSSIGPSAAHSCLGMPSQSHK